MPLKLTLKPDEKVLIGTAVISNAGQKAEIVIQNTVPVLREKDIITEEKADTIAKKIYFMVLNMYVDTKNEREYHNIYFKLVDELFKSSSSPEIMAYIMETSQKILEGDHYQALKICKKLLNYEAELLTDVTE
jgi:flagellar protein FlbT